MTSSHIGNGVYVLSEGQTKPVIAFPSLRRALDHARAKYGDRTWLVDNGSYKTRLGTPDIHAQALAMRSDDGQRVSLVAEWKSFADPTLHIRYVPYHAFPPAIPTATSPAVVRSAEEARQRREQREQQEGTTMEPQQPIPNAQPHPAVYVLVRVMSKSTHREQSAVQRRRTRTALAAVSDRFEDLAAIVTAGHEHKDFVEITEHSAQWDERVIGVVGSTTGITVRSDDQPAWLNRVWFADAKYGTYAHGKFWYYIVPVLLAAPKIQVHLERLDRDPRATPFVHQGNVRFNVGALVEWRWPGRMTMFSGKVIAAADDYREVETARGRYHVHISILRSQPYKG